MSQTDHSQRFTAFAEALRAACDTLFGQPPQAITRKGDQSLVTALDHASQSAIGRLLAAHFPGEAMLGEEMPAARQQALLETPGRALWCVDPLDGTGNYAAGIPFYAVSAARIEAGRVTHGVVYDPVRRELFTAGAGQGARLDGKPLARTRLPGQLEDAMANVDFKRLDAGLATRLVTTQPWRSQRNFGACALEWAWLAAGRLHVYLHGGMKLWDHAAGSLILSEAGGASRTLAGEPVFTPRLAARSVVAAATPGLLAQWARRLAAEA